MFIGRAPAQAIGAGGRASEKVETRAHASRALQQIDEFGCWRLSRCECRTKPKLKSGQEFVCQQQQYTHSCSLFRCERALD